MTSALDQAEAWRRLEAHLAWAAGFWIVWVFGDEPAAVRRLRERAMRAVRASGGRTRLLRPTTPQALREAVRELVGGAREAELTVVEALSTDEPWAEAWDDVVVRLNERRERLRTSLGGGLVLAAGTALKVRFRERAPDLWSIRSLVLELAPTEAAAPTTNARRIAEAVLRVRFHRRTAEGPWFALVLSDDPAPRRRLLDALVADGLRVLVHAGVSPALREPGPDLHWLLCEEPVVTLPDALAQASAPVMVEGAVALEGELVRAAPELALAAAFAVRLAVERAVHPGPPAALAGTEAAVQDAFHAIDRAEALGASLPALRGPEAARARSERVRALAHAVEALLAQGWSTEALPLAEELIDAATHLPRGDPGALAAEADALELCGRTAGQSGDGGLARERYGAALPLRRRLARTRGPQRIRRRSELARCLSIHGELALQAGDAAAAEPALREALAIRRRLARLTDDRETLTELATAWSMVGDLELARHDTGDGRVLARATEAYREALRLRERVASEQDAPRFRRLLSVALGRYGTALSRARDWAGARAAWATARDLARALADADPGNVAWQVEASVAASRLGDAARALGETAMAQAAYREAVEFRQQLAAGDPENARWHELLAVALGRLADVALERGDLAGAAKAAARSVSVSEHLAWIDPGHLQWRRGLASAWLRAGDVARARGDTDGAAAAWRRALGCAAELATVGGPDALKRAREIVRELEARGTPDAELGPVRGRLMGVGGR